MTESANLALELTRYGAIGIIAGQMCTIIYIIWLLSQAYKMHQDVLQKLVEDSTKAQIESTKAFQQLTDNIRNSK